MKFAHQSATIRQHGKGMIILETALETAGLTYVFPDGNGIRHQKLQNQVFIPCQSNGGIPDFSLHSFCIKGQVLKAKYFAIVGGGRLLKAPEHYMTKRLLTQHGYCVTSAYSGSEALLLIEITSNLITFS